MPRLLRTEHRRRHAAPRRQAEYAAALLAFKGTKIKPWNIRDTGKRIRRDSMASQISLLRYHFDDDIVESYHTPVTDALVSFGENDLGNLLHSQRAFRRPDDDWWGQTRERLLAGYRLAWIACRGDSTVPPLYDSKTKLLHPQRIEMMDHNKALFDRPTLAGTRLTVEVLYLDDPPTAWICDL